MDEPQGDIDWGMLTPSDEELIEEARWNHEHHPAAHARCPECNRFSRSPWEKSFGTQNGMMYVWGGVCPHCGPWTDNT